MSFDTLGPGGLDYRPCRYGTSKILFRGPKRSLDEPYVAFFGGTTTYGKFVQTPFASLVEQSLNFNCINFGSVNGGISGYRCHGEAPETSFLLLIRIWSKRSKPTNETFQSFS